MKKDLPDYTHSFAFDIEANELLEKVSKVWCIVAQDILTDVFYIYHDYPEFDNCEVTDPEDGKTYVIQERSGSLIDGARFVYQVNKNKGRIICHNALSYDKPLIEKFWPKCVTNLETWWDTLIQSKVQWYDRPIPKGARGNHGLQAYGCILGVPKPDVKDWSFMDAWKLHRCIEDVKIQAKTYKYLEKERSIVKERLGIDFTESLLREHQFRTNCTKQELNGAAVDTYHMQQCVGELTSIIESLRKEIEPNLPKQVKPKSIKISKSELGALFGLEVKDTFSIINGDSVIDKPYYKPVTKFTKTEVKKSYVGVKEGYENTPAFNKLSEVRDYVKLNYPETKLKDWTFEKSDNEVKTLNTNTCDYFDIASTDTSLVSGPFTKVEFLDSKLTQGDIVKSYLISLGWKTAPEWTLKKDSEGQLVKVKQDTIVKWPEKPVGGDPNNQIIKLVKKGQPLVVAPKLTDECFESLPEGLGKKISDYNTYQHRLRFLKNPEDDTKGLLNNVRPDGRITCGINNFNTSTSRSSHSLFVNCPSESAIYGEKLRASIIAPEGKILVGADMRSCQLALAAYYSNNYEYYKAVAEGNEFKINADGSEMINPDTGKPWYIGESGHCFSARMFGLVSEADWQRAVETQNQELIHHLHLVRKYGKAASFGTIFGCSGKKLSTMLKCPENEGEHKKNMFLNKVGLSRVIEILDSMVTANTRCNGGYIELPFGYHVWCQQKHKQVNYLIQGSEAMAQRFAVNYMEERATREGLDYKKIIDMHDEMLVEVSEEDSEKLGNIMSEAYTISAYELREWHRKNSKWFTGNDLPDFCIDLSSGFKMGKNYAECH